jgi:transposase
MLPAEQRQALRRRSRQASIASSTRDRLEMVRRSDAGWSVPKIAHHLGLHEQPVRAWIKVFLIDGFDALPNKPRGGSHSALTSTMLDAVRIDVASGERTWSAGQIADWVAEQYGVRLSEGRMRVHLKRAMLSYQRTSRRLQHKQQAHAVTARKAALAALEKKGVLD